MAAKGTDSREADAAVAGQSCSKIAVNGIRRKLCDDGVSGKWAAFSAGTAVTNSNSPASFPAFVTVFIELNQTAATMKAVESARFLEACAAEDMRLAPGTGS